MKNTIIKFGLSLTALLLVSCSPFGIASSDSTSFFSSSSSDSSSESTPSSQDSDLVDTSSNEESSASSENPSSESSSSEESSSMNSSESSSSSEEIGDEDVVWVGTDSYPYYSSPSTRFAMSLQAGWNLGNSLDAHMDSVNTESSFIDLQEANNNGINELDTETCFGNPKITLELLRKVREEGFTTIRIPVSWHQHVLKWNNFQISSTWMNRVKTVVDQALSLGFKVILNSHHDIDPSFVYPDNAHLENSKKYIQSLWTQISNVFGDYDTNLVYEGFNEPRLTKESDPFNTELNTEEVRTCINSLNQTFVDTIRASSKTNEQKRYLMIKGYADSPYVITYANSSGFVVPTDPINHLIVSVHLYSPTEFAFKGTGGFDKNSDEDTSHINWILNGLYQHYIANGIGVVVGEWGSVATSYNLEDRVEHADYFVNQTYLRHISSIYWDNGNIDGEAFALFNRQTNQNLYPSMTQTINSYWAQDTIKHSVKYYNGSSLIAMEMVNDGEVALGPSLPWAYGYDGLYLDSNCTNSFDLSNKITEDLVVYLGNYGVRPTSTIEADNNWGPIDSSYIYVSDGAWYCTCPGKGKSNNYETQVNFELPALENDANYKISFTYKITGYDAYYLVYNDATKDTVTHTTKMEGDSSWHIMSLEFDSSNVTYGQTRFTFSLSSISKSVSAINFGLKDISIAKM